MLLPDHASTSITPAVALEFSARNEWFPPRSRSISLPNGPPSWKTLLQWTTPGGNTRICANTTVLSFMWAHPFDTQPHVFSVDQTSLFPSFPNKRLPTRSCSSKVSMALARSWKSLSSFESIPGMLCIACLGRGWQNDPANHANLTLLPPNRSSFLDPNEFGPNSYRKSWTARARVTTSLMVQDTTSCQLLSASYLALGEDPQRQNVSGFCTNTKRHRRVNAKVAVSLKISTISNPNNTSSYWSLS